MIITRIKVFSRTFLRICSLIFLVVYTPYFQACKPASNISSRPNIVIFYVDDLGYGDLGVYGGDHVKTPFVDKLSQGGTMFTNAHSTAATCTPSRYSLLTGEYAFRNNAAILPGDAPLIIPTTKPTLPAMLKKAGYSTGVIGKWHLGLGDGQVNWNASVKPGPLEIGFDYSFLLPSTGDRVPSVYLENHGVVNADPNDPIEVSYSKKLIGYPNGLDNPSLLRQKADTQHSNTIVNGVSRIGYMQGGRAALWKDEDFPRVLSGKANQFISDHKDKPFFLFFSFHDIHVPRIPSEQFAGKSPLGARGDVILQMDWTTEQIVRHLDSLHLLENTIIIFTSDNGPVLNDGYEDLADKLVGDHKPAGPYRGGKYSAFEAGTRVPMIVSWKGKELPKKSVALISQVDFYRSFASLLGIKLEIDEAMDSEDHSNALLGKTQRARTWMLEESYSLAAIKGNWKYIRPIPENKNLPAFMANKGVESGLSRMPQLYNLDADPGETKNLAAENISLVSEMQGYIDQVLNKKNTVVREASSKK